MIQTSLGKKPFAQDTIQTVIDQLADDSSERVATAILMRLTRSYNTLTLDSIEYVLVPTIRKEPV